METKQKIIVVIIFIVLFAAACLATAFFVNKTDADRHYYKNTFPSGYSIKVLVKAGDGFVDLTEDLSDDGGIELEEGYFYRLEIYTDTEEIYTVKEFDLRSKAGFYSKIKAFGALKIMWILASSGVVSGIIAYFSGRAVSAVKAHIRKKKKEIKT